MSHDMGLFRIYTCHSSAEECTYSCWRFIPLLLRKELTSAEVSLHSCLGLSFLPIKDDFDSANLFEESAETHIYDIHINPSFFAWNINFQTSHHHFFNHYTYICSDESFNDDAKKLSNSKIMAKIKVQGTENTVVSVQNEDYISLTDMAHC